VAPRQDRAAWQATMDKMVALGAKGTQKDFDAIVDYLAKTYPAEEVPKIKVNEARAIELESGLSLTRSQAAAVIQYRTRNGDFKSIEDLKKVPGIDAAKIEARKDRLLF
jgi:competence protein ComEA